MKFIKESNFSLAYVVLLWVFLTAMNIDKAYHIDDTFHLEAAEHIRQNPLKPMSGLINWGSNPTPMYKHNQPPLFFYLIAAHQSIFGKSEISSHLLLSIFTLLALIYFVKIANFLNAKSILLITTIFAFCPAFVVNQNLMTDMPILAISLAVMYYLLKGQKLDNTPSYILAAILLSIGLLIKYSLLPVFCVSLITILFSKSPKNSIIFIIPVFTLLLWSIANYVEFDAIHILTRKPSRFSIIRIVSFVSTVGAVATFSSIFIYYYFPKKLTKVLIFSFYLLFIAAVPLVYFGIIDEAWVYKFLLFAFPLNGILLFCLIAYQAYQAWLHNKYSYFKSPYFILFIYIVGVSSFVALFAPFSATRHILLIIPFILLFGNKLFEVSSPYINRLVVTTTVVFGILIGISDWVYADFYREKASNIELPERNVWSLGHWGWQWYSKKAGMTFYAKEKEYQVRKGDIIIFPTDVSKQELSQDFGLDTLYYIIDKPNFTTFFSVKNFASMYNSSIKKPAWTLSNAPIDTIYICEVIHELDTTDIVNRINSDKEGLNKVKNNSKHSNLPLNKLLMIEAKSLLIKRRNN